MNLGCIEHIDFAQDEDDVDNSLYPIFTEADSKFTHFKMRSSMRQIPVENLSCREKDLEHLDDNALIHIIARNNTENLSMVAFAVFLISVNSFILLFLLFRLPLCRGVIPTILLSKEKLVSFRILSSCYCFKFTCFSGNSNGENLQTIMSVAKLANGQILCCPIKKNY